jgi:hypothetical protein
MNTAKHEVQVLMQRLPDSCTLEDVQYHLYVLEKIQRGVDRAEKDGCLAPEEVEERLGKWISERTRSPNWRILDLVN